MRVASRDHQHVYLRRPIHPLEMCETEIPGPILETHLPNTYMRYKIGGYSGQFTIMKLSGVALAPIFFSSSHIAAARVGRFSGFLQTVQPSRFGRDSPAQWWILLHPDLLLTGIT